MRVIVFGGSGFLGSHVADTLTDSGYSVWLFDKKKSPFLKKNQKMIIGDILDEDKVLDVVKGAKYVYNFASIADITESSERPLEAIKSNILGHAVILNACAERKVERIIYASSMYIYSRFGSFYRVTKQSCELLTEAYYEKYGLKYVILRYGSLYGPRSQAWNAIYCYLSQAFLENKIDYPGSGEEIREYIHVFDAARLSLEILKPEFENQSVIITGTQTLSSKELLSMIKEMLGKDIKINFLNTGRYHHYTFSPYVFSPRQAKKLVSNSFVDIGHGLLEVAEEIYKNNHKEFKQVSDWYVEA